MQLGPTLYSPLGLIDRLGSQCLSLKKLLSWKNLETTYGKFAYITKIISEDSKRGRKDGITHSFVDQAQTGMWACEQLASHKPNGIVDNCSYFSWLFNLLCRRTKAIIKSNGPRALSRNQKKKNNGGTQLIRKSRRLHSETTPGINLLSFEYSRSWSSLKRQFCRCFMKPRQHVQAFLVTRGKSKIYRTPRWHIIALLFSRSLSQADSQARAFSERSPAVVDDLTLVVRFSAYPSHF